MSPFALFATRRPVGPLVPTPIRPAPPQDLPLPLLDAWAAQAGNGQERELRDHLVSVLRLANRYPANELSLHTCSPDAFLDMPEAAAIEWASARKGKLPALTTLDLPRGLSRLPRWLAELAPFGFLSAKEFKGDIKKAERAARADKIGALFL